MAKTTKLTNLEIDEVSCVDAGANQHAAIVLAKRDGNSDIEVEKLGTMVDGSSSHKGDDRMEEKQTVEELKAELKKANDGLAAVTELQKQFKVMEDENKVLKAKQEEESKRADEAAKVAKAEKDLRLLGEFKEVAKKRINNLAGDDDTKAKLLKALNENLPSEDYEAVVKMLEQGSVAMAKHFQPVGVSGAAGENTAQGQLEALAKKRATDKSISYSKALIEVSQENGALYAEAQAERRAN